VALVYGLVARLTTLRRGYLAALLYAVNPVSFLYVGSMLTEILLAFLMTLTFLVSFVGREREKLSAAVLALIETWWRRLPALARWLWPVSAALHGLGYGLLLAGLWSLRTRPGVLFSLGLTFLYLALMPGPIAYIRFWMPAVPLAVGVMACAFAPRGGVRDVA
jgi:4-amino-4-deoxy-L-arabinose transferase-like glycosyltransferase